MAARTHAGPVTDVVGVAVLDATQMSRSPAVVPGGGATVGALTSAIPETMPATTGEAIGYGSTQETIENGLVAIVESVESTHVPATGSLPCWHGSDCMAFGVSAPS